MAGLKTSRVPPAERTATINRRLAEAEPARG
jgi:hypothetical protein